MAFGRNPHIAKAQLAEQKAKDAQDAASRARLWREAAHLWERAAKKEADAKASAEHMEHAEQARAKADEPAPEQDNPVGALVLRMAELQKKKALKSEND